jgi:hypothetical protein
MITKVTQRFPNFMTGFDPKIENVKTIEELSSIEFVKRWIDTGFSLYKSDNILMAHRNLDGKDVYWAIAYLENLSFDIPNWDEEWKQILIRKGEK